MERQQHTEMTMEQLQNVTLTTGKLLESPTEDFIAYLQKRTLGELMGLKNYLEAEFERVRQVKDLLVERAEKLNIEQIPETINGLYKILSVIENRHGVILQFIEKKRG